MIPAATWYETDLYYVLPLYWEGGYAIGDAAAWSNLAEPSDIWTDASGPSQTWTNKLKPSDAWTDIIEPTNTWS